VVEVPGIDRHPVTGRIQGEGELGVGELVRCPRPGVSARHHVAQVSHGRVERAGGGGGCHVASPPTLAAAVALAGLLGAFSFSCTGSGAGSLACGTAMAGAPYSGISRSAPMAFSSADPAGTSMIVPRPSRCGARSQVNLTSAVTTPRVPP